MLGRGLVPIREPGKRASSSKKACGGQAFGRWKLAPVVGPWKGCMSIDSVPVGSLVQSPCNGERPIPLCSKVAAWDRSPIQRCLGCLEPRAFFCRFEIGAIQQRDQHQNRQGSGAEAKLEGRKIGPKVAIKQCLFQGPRPVSAMCQHTKKSGRIAPGLQESRGVPHSGTASSSQEMAKACSQAGGRAGT